MAGYAKLRENVAGLIAQGDVSLTNSCTVPMTLLAPAATQAYTFTAMLDPSTTDDDLGLAASMTMTSSGHTLSLWQSFHWYGWATVALFVASPLIWYVVSLFRPSSRAERDLVFRGRYVRVPAPLTMSDMNEILSNFDARRHSRNHSPPHRHRVAGPRRGGSR